MSIVSLAFEIGEKVVSTFVSWTWTYEPRAYLTWMIFPGITKCFCWYVRRYLLPECSVNKIKPIVKSFENRNDKFRLVFDQKYFEKYYCRGHCFNELEKWEYERYFLVYTMAYYGSYACDISMRILFAFAIGREIELYGSSWGKKIGSWLKP
jgi:hypothetical protein